MYMIVLKAMAKQNDPDTCHVGACMHLHVWITVDHVKYAWTVLCIVHLCTTHELSLLRAGSTGLCTYGPRFAIARSPASRAQGILIQ